MRAIRARALRRQAHTLSVEQRHHPQAAGRFYRYVKRTWLAARRGQTGGPPISKGDIPAVHAHTEPHKLPFTYRDERGVWVARYRPADVPHGERPSGRRRPPVFIGWDRLAESRAKGA